MEHQAAIATLGDVVVQREFKVLVLFVGDDVPGVVAIAHDRTVDDLPALGDLVLLVVSPALSALAIKQQFPTSDRFGAGEGIGWLLGPSD